MVAPFRSYPESAGLCGGGSPPRGRADRVLTGRAGVVKVQRTKPGTRVPAVFLEDDPADEILGDPGHLLPAGRA